MAVLAGALVQAHAQLEWVDPIKDPQIRPLPAHFDIIIKGGGVAYWDTLDGANWKNREKNVVAKDANGNLVAMTNSFWNSSSNAFDNKEGIEQTLTYNSSNQVTSARMVIYQNNEVNLVRISNYTYESNGRFLPVTGVDSIFETGNTMGIGFKDSIVYNASGKIAERIKTINFMGTELPREKMAFTYDANGRLTQAEKYEWDDAWIEDNKLQYTYTTSGKVETLITSYFDEGTSAWILDNLDSFYYNSSDLQIKSVNYYHNNGNWEPDGAEEFTYNGNNIIQVIEIEHDGTNWTNDRKVVINYTGNAPTGANVYNWEGSDWATTFTERIRFEQLPVSVNKISALAAVKVYPNPANEVVTIAMPNLKQANVTVYNLAGAVVKTAIIGAEPTLTIADLNNGIYIVEVVQGNEMFRTKLVKN